MGSTAWSDLIPARISLGYNQVVLAKRSMASLPSFNESGDSPPGIHVMSLEDVLAHFGIFSSARQQIGGRLTRIYTLAKGTGHLARFIIFGSFVTSEPAPNDEVS